MIERSPELELLAPPVLSIVCFRHVPSGWAGDEAGLDALNKAIMEAVQAGGEAFVTQAVLGRGFWLRANVLHYATTEEDLVALVDIVRTVGERLAAR
jgi:glutamate/tyrosine decarboxylase-like PLP-dependent enzyme